MLNYRYLPINIFLGYLALIAIAWIVGPIKYHDPDLLRLMLFLVPLTLFLFMGFVEGARGSLCSSPHSNFILNRQRALIRVKIFFQFLLLVSATSAFFNWLELVLSAKSFSIAAMGANYLSTYDGYERGAARIDLAYVINIAEQTLTTLAVLMSIYYYKNLKRSHRLIACFIIVTYVIVNVIGSGKQKYLGDILIFGGYGLLINYAAQRSKLTGIMGPLLFIILLIFSFAFVEILAQRYLAAGIGFENIHEKLHPLMYWDNDVLLLKVIPEDYGISVGMFLGYFTNGLYGLSLGLQLPIEWSYFVGNSYSLGRIVEIILNAPGVVLQNTVPYRVGEVYGWDASKWHSLFAWMASDLTFPGVLFVSPFFGFIYGRTWIKAVRCSNPFAGPLFIYLSLGVVFSFSNNQLLHSLQGLLALVLLVMGYLLCGKGRRYAECTAQLPSTC